jgi:glycosyltransferase involved in cell wall biosynthesis
MEWVKDAGLVFPPSDSKALAEKIIILLKDNQLRKKLGEKGRRIIVDWHDYKTEMKKIEYFFMSLVK